jgi:hypothetical protein
MSGWANHIEPTRGTRRLSIWPALSAEASDFYQAQAYRLNSYGETPKAAIKFPVKSGVQA